jgi:hypothetical protein
MILSRSSPFHAGEREVQRRVHVAEEAQAVGRIVAGTLSPAVRRFLAGQRMAVAASVDEEGRPWASLVTGRAGFLEALDERLLRIGVEPGPGDPLAANLRTRPELALVVLDPRTRQRMRLNGRGLLDPNGVFLQVDQVYGNCPKYITRRRLAGEADRPPMPPVRSRGLDATHRDFVARADTFFIATTHPEAGADASHRGGNPGFVRVRDERRITFPDYPGNNMFNTLGNLVAHPHAGLLFVDFATGDLLQLTGRARLRFEPEREVEIEIEEVLETRGGSPLRWELVEPAPENP